MAGQQLRELRVVAGADIPGVHGVLETECALVLAELHAQPGIFLPFDEIVFHVELVVVCLHLDAVGEVAENLSIDVETYEALAEPGAGVLALLARAGVFAYEVRSEFRCRDVVCHVTPVMGL